MDRYRYRDELEFIHHTISTLPKKVQKLLEGTQFITSFCPVYIGLPMERDWRSSDGRTLKEVSFVIEYDRRATVVLRREHIFDRKCLLHELGHAVLFDSNDDAPEWIDPLDDYAAIRYHESYATAFQSFLTKEPLHEWYYHNWEELLNHDISTYRYFEKQFLISPHKL